MAITTIMVAVAGLAMAGYQAYKANQLAKGMAAMSEEQFNQQQAKQQEQQAKLDKQKEIYKKFQFQNPYANMENAYENLQNVYEDLTVGTQAADFQMEQGAQQRANIMRGLRGAAGASGIAGLAQALANQGQLQAQQVSANIQQQEMRNQALKAQGAAQIQQMEAQGATAADLAERGGEALLQQAEMDRQATLLGIEYGGAAGANAAVQAAMSNQMSAMASQMQTYSSNAAAMMNLAGQAAGMGGGSSVDPNWTDASGRGWETYYPNK